MRIGSVVNLTALRRVMTGAVRMTALPSNVRVWLACGHTDMRRGFEGLASQVLQHLGQDLLDGQFAFSTANVAT